MNLFDKMCELGVVDCIALAVYDFYHKCFYGDIISDLFEISTVADALLDQSTIS